MGFGSRIGMIAALLVLYPPPAAAQSDGVVTALRGDIGVKASPGSLLSRPASLHVQDVTIPEALTMLSEVSRVSIAFSPNSLPGDLPVTCECVDVDLAQALDRILAETRFGYLEFEDQIVISPRKRDDLPQPARSGIRLASLPPSISIATVPGPRAAVAPARQGRIIGSVVEHGTQRPVAGAVVSVVGTDIAGLTNTEGRYELSDVPAREVTVRVEMLGYARAERAETVQAGGTRQLDFELRPDALLLDGIVVTGQAGQARRREVGTTIGQVQVGELPSPPTSVAGVLRGRVTSMTVAQGTSQLGSGQAIRLRGNVSVSRSNQPLVYIDGVRQAADHLPRPQALGMIFSGTNTHPGTLESLNPADIERIEVVKGAAAATLYGSEAAAGVIQIFTKRGAEGAPRWTYQTNQSLSRVQKFGSDERPYLNMDPFLKTAFGQQHSLSVSGGTREVRYFFSGGFEDRDGPRGIDEQTKINLRGNINVNLRDDLEFQWNTAYSDDDLLLTHTGANLWGLEFNAFRAPNNTVGSADPAVIARLLDAEIHLQNRRLNTGVTVRYAPTRRFSNQLVVGLDRFMAEVRQVIPFGFILRSEGFLDERFWTRQGVSLDYTGTYAFDLGVDLRSSLSWGGQWITTEEVNLSGFGEGLPGPGVHTLLSTAVRQTGSSRQRVIDTGLFLQNVFDYRDRYFVTLGARVDGNSTFGDDFGLQLYPKVGASYVVSDEPFWRDGWGSLRLRAAFGQAGRAPGPFDAVRTWTPYSFAGNTAFLTSNLGNPDLGPERSTELEGGLEAALLGGRLQLDLTAYRQQTTDALMEVQSDPSLGFIAGQLQNIGKLRNRGFEVDVNAAVLEQPGFTWRVGANLSTNSNRVLDTGGQTFANVVVGHPAPVRRGTRVLNPDELAEPIFEQNVPLGATQPTRILGLSTGLDLANGIALFGRGEYQGGHYLPSAMDALVNRGNGAPYCDPSMSGAYAHVPYDEWRADHPGLSSVNALDRARCYRETALPGIWNVRGDFFKIRDITLRLPVGFAVPRASSAFMTLSVGNIRVWTRDYKVLDPETTTRISEGEGVLDTTFGEGGGNFTPAPIVGTLGLRITF